jgi:two-component system LytT family response regulator
VQDIVYLEADSNYTIFHLLNGSKIVASKTLAEFEPQLTDSFFRIHKSFNINLNHVNEYVKKDGNSVLMNDGALLPVARRKNEELIQVLLTH